MNTTQNIPPLYTSITDIPLSNFVEVLVDGNYSRLIRTGNHPGEQALYDAWYKIISEYGDAMGSHEQKLWLNLFKEAGVLEITLFQVNSLVEILEVTYYEPFVVMLNKLLHTNFILDPDKPEEYFKTLKSALMRSKAFKIDLDLKRLHMTAIEEKAKTEAAPYTKAYFQSVLITISDHSKYHLDMSITVFEFCERVKRWNKYCEELQKSRK